MPPPPSPRHLCFSGIEVHGTEYTFGSGGGIFTHAPKVRVRRRRAGTGLRRWRRVATFAHRQVMRLPTHPYHHLHHSHIHCCRGHCTLAPLPCVLPRGAGCSGSPGALLYPAGGGGRQLARGAVMCGAQPSPASAHACHHCTGAQLSTHTHTHGHTHTPLPPQVDALVERMKPEWPGQKYNTIKW